MIDPLVSDTMLGEALAILASFPSDAILALTYRVTHGDSPRGASDAELAWAYDKLDAWHVRRRVWLAAANVMRDPA